MTSYGLGNPGGDFASAFAQGQQLNSQKAMLMIQRQRANLDAWGDWAKLSQMDSDTINALGPQLQTAQGVDPKSDSAKMQIKALADKSDAFGQKLSSFYGMMAGGAGATLDPVTAHKLFNSDPMGFMQFATKLHATNELGGAMNALSGNGPSSASQGWTPPGVNQPSVQGAGNAPSGAAPMPSGTPANGPQAPNSAMPGGGVRAPTQTTPTAPVAVLPGNTPLAAGGKTLADVAPVISQMRSLATRYSALLPEASKSMNDQADAIERNAIQQEAQGTAAAGEKTREGELDVARGNLAVAQSKVPIEAAQAAASTSQAATAAKAQQFKQLEETYGKPMPPDEVNSMGMPPGTVAFRSGTGKPLIADKPPDSTLADQYVKPAQAMIGNGQVAKQSLGQINTLLTINNAPGSKPPAGAIPQTRHSIGVILNAMGMKNLGTSVLGSAPLADLQKSQISGLILSGLDQQGNSGFGGASVRQEELQSKVSDYLDTREGQNLILYGLQAQAQHQADAGDAVLSHMKQFGNPWTRDPSGDDAITKGNAELGRAAIVPDNLATMINVSSVGGDVQTPKAPTGQAQSSLIQTPTSLPPKAQRADGMKHPTIPGLVWSKAAADWVRQ